MLEVRGLSKSFGGVKAADDITLNFADGSLTAVIGPNGAGKSTFFNLITGALRPDSGRILLGGVDMAEGTPPECLRAGARRAPQSAAILPSRDGHRKTFSRCWRGPRNARPPLPRT